MIHQINIVVDQNTDSVDGYNNISIENLPGLTNGYVESIIFTTIDKLDSKSRQEYFVECLKKLCHGGSLTVKFLNLNQIATKLKNSHMNGKEFANLIRGVNSCWTERDFLEFISNINGFGLIKMFYENANIVAVLQKNK